MEVQILSVLAGHVSQLAGLSGVKQLLHPHIQSKENVEKLISTWCDGLGSVPSTWRHLLEAISGVGLPELCANTDL